MLYSPRRFLRPLSKGSLSQGFLFGGAEGKRHSRNCPGVDEIIPYDEKGKDRGFFAKLRLVLRLRRERFDVVFILHRSWTRALLVFLAGIPQRVGHDTKRRGVFLTHRIPLPEGAVHRSDFYLSVIEGYGITVQDRSCRLLVAQKAAHELDQILTREGISSRDSLMVVNAGGNWDLKRWPKENFIELIKTLAQNLKYRIVLSGAQKDVTLTQEIAQTSGVNPVVLAGKTDLKQLLALMARSKLVISADSGPLHMASGVGTPVIALFGPTRPEITGPRGPGQAVILQKDVGCNKTSCYNLTCSDNVCMKAVTVEDVVAAVKQILI